MKENLKLILDKNYFAVKKSKLHGEGLFSETFFPSGFELGPSLIHKSISEKFKDYITDQCHADLEWEFVQTTATRFINHSNNPNIEVYRKEPYDGIIYAKCITDININDEITSDYKKDMLICEDCSDPNIIKLFSSIIGISKEELLKYINSQNKIFKK